MFINDDIENFVKLTFLIFFVGHSGAYPIQISLKAKTTIFINDDIEKIFQLTILIFLVGKLLCGINIKALPTRLRAVWQANIHVSETVETFIRKSTIESETIEWFIEGQAFSRLYDLASRPYSL